MNPLERFRLDGKIVPTYSTSEADLAGLDLRLAAPVLPGATVVVISGQRDGLVRAGTMTVLSGGKAWFA